MERRLPSKIWALKLPQTTSSFLDWHFLAGSSEKWRSSSPSWLTTRTSRSAIKMMTRGRHCENLTMIVRAPRTNDTFECAPVSCWDGSPPAIRLRPIQ